MYLDEDAPLELMRAKADPIAQFVEEVNAYSFGWFTHIGARWVAAHDAIEVRLDVTLPSADEFASNSVGPGLQGQEVVVLVRRVPIPEIVGVFGGDVKLYAREIVHGMLHQVMEHELKEWFRYRGERVFDPHPEVPK